MHHAKEESFTLNRFPLGIRNTAARSPGASSYAATTTQFRSQNTAQVWAEVSEDARPPLGALVARSLLSNEWVPTPEGYVMVKYRTDFANRAGVIETVTMVKEEGAWKVSGVIID